MENKIRLTSYTIAVTVSKKIFTTLALQDNILTTKVIIKVVFNRTAVLNILGHNINNKCFISLFVYSKRYKINIYFMVKLK